jgi:hypothetical protein
MSTPEPPDRRRRSRPAYEFQYDPRNLRPHVSRTRMSLGGVLNAIGMGMLFAVMAGCAGVVYLLATCKVSGL